MLFPQICSTTPNKRIKLNEESTFQNSKNDKKIKPSFLFRLNNGDLSKSKTKDQKVEVSQFQLAFQYKPSSSNDSNDFIEQQVEDFQMKRLILSKKMTYIHQQQSDYNMQSLKLYRNNSNLQQAPQAQQIQLGDNIYLRSILSTTQNKHKKSSSNNHHRATESSRDMNSLRIDQDYQIQTSLDLRNRNHNNYICLNKLERIFYYVKKIKMDWNHQHYQFLREMAENQIKIYAHDPKGYFIRYYQSWFQHNALYLTYEVAVESLEERSRVHKKLREVEVWSLLKDCCSSLQWLCQSQGYHHLNLKPGNIIKCHQKYKLSDPFSTTKILQHYIKQESNWSGYHYLAPEIKEYYPLIQGLDLSKSDIYSLSICIIQNLLGQNHLPKEPKNMRQYIKTHLHGYSPSLIKTLLKMISLNPTNRPKLSEIASFGNRSPTSQKQHKIRRFSI